MANTASDMAGSLTNLQALLVLPVRQAQECLKPPPLAQREWVLVLVRLVPIPMPRWLDSPGKLNGLEPTRALTTRTTGVVCRLQLTIATDSILPCRLLWPARRTAGSWGCARIVLKVTSQVACCVDENSASLIASGAEASLCFLPLLCIEIRLSLSTNFYVQLT
jgi:hypothetical protein